MKTLLISILFGSQSDIENIGLERIHAYIKLNGKDVDLIYINQSDGIDSALEQIGMDYDIVAFSAYQDNIDFTCLLSLSIKRLRPDVLIVYGSKYITSYYREIVSFEMGKSEPCFDLLVLGDGEYAMLSIIDCMEKNEDIKQFANQSENIATLESIKNKKPISININELPIPERTYTKNSNSITAYICDSHGCLGNCSFCASNYYHNWSGRSAESLFNEVFSVYHSTKAKIFIFTGSSFEDPGDIGKEKIDKFCDLVLNSGMTIAFRCYLRAETFKDNECDAKLLRKMKSAGFNQIYVGIESNNEDELRLYLKRSTLADNARILRLLEAANIFCGLYGFIMFNPYSSLDKIRNNYLFIANNHPFNIYSLTSKVIIYNGTLIYEKVKNDNLIIAKEKSTYNMMEEYHFIDKDVSELFGFVNTILSAEGMTEVIWNIGSTSSLMYSFSNLPGMEESMAELSYILSHFETIIADYFNWLYAKHDIGFCERILGDFKDDLIENNRKLRILKGKFIKRIMKHNIYIP